MKSKLLKVIGCISFSSVFRWLSVMFVLVLFQERSASQPSRQHLLSVTLSRIFSEVQKIYSVSSPAPLTRLGTNFSDILIAPATVIFHSHNCLVLTGSVLQDDPGCCSKDWLPQTSTAALHLFPCPARGSNQDERQRRKLLDLPHGHTQADKKQSMLLLAISRLTLPRGPAVVSHGSVIRRSTSTRFLEERTRWKSTGSTVETLMLMSPSCI